MDFILIIGGIFGLMLGGDQLVKGAVAIAQRFGVPPLIIGLTLVGFGTSTPELVTSLQAAMAGAPGIAIGNVVGSNTANILLILGLSAVIAPVVVSKSEFRRDGAFFMVATLLCVLAVASGHVGLGFGVMFIVGLFGFLGYMIYVGMRTSAASEMEDTRAAPKLGQAILQLLIGMVITIFAAKFLVMGAVSLATAMGVSEAVIGLTIVAVGTSMPELVTSVIAMRRGQGDVAFGNVVGSNIFNILGILGITALVKPMTVPAEIIALDIWVMLLASLALVAFAISHWVVSRREGIILIGAYLAYLGYLVATA